MPAIMPALFENLQGAQFETDAKLAAIIAIGDICLASGGAFTEYAGNALNSFKGACVSSLQVSDDEDDNAIFQQLR